MANIGELTLQLGVNARGLRTGLGRANRRIKAFSDRAKRNLTSVQGAALGLGVTLGAGIVFRSVIQGGAKFEKTMVTVVAVMRATNDEMIALTASAREMGATTEFTATQAAEALRFLGMAGFTATKAIAALPGVLDLATSGNLDLGRAADIASNALTAMRLPVEQLGRVNDVLLGTTTRANVDINEMAEAFKFAAPIAQAYGFTIEELSGLIGKLGDAGIKGSLAGTQIAQAIIKANEIALKFKLTSADLIDVLDDLGEMGASTTDITNLFGVRPGRAALVFSNMIDEVRELQFQLTQTTGEAKNMADAIRGTLSGAFDTFKSTLESVALDTFKVWNQSLRNALESATNWLRGNRNIFNDLARIVRQAVMSVKEVLTGLFDGIGILSAALLRTLSNIAGEGITTGSVWQNVINGIIGGMAVISRVTANVLIIIGGVMRAVGSVIKSTLSIAIEGIKDAVGVIRDLIAILDSLMTAASQALGGNFTAAATSLQIISNFTGTVLDDINANIDAQQSRVRAMVSSLSQIQLETLAAMDLTPLGDVFTEAVAKAIADGVRQGAMDGAKDITTIFQNMGLFDAQFLGPPNISVFGADLMGPPQLRTISHFKAPDPALLTDTVGTAQSAMQTMGGVFTEFAGLVEAVTGRLDTGFGRVLRALQSLLGIVEKMQGLGAIFGVGGVASDLAGGAAKQFGKEIGKASAQETARQSASSGGGGSALGKIAAALGPIAAIASAAIAFKGGPQTIKLKTASRSQIEEAALQAFNARRDIRDFLESDMFVRKTDDGAFFTQLGGRVGLVETIEPSFQGTTELPGFQREFFRNGDTHVTVQAMDSRSFHNFNDDMDNQAGRDSLRQFGG